MVPSTCAGLLEMDSYSLVRVVSGVDYYNLHDCVWLYYVHMRVCACVRVSALRVQSLPIVTPCM